MKILERTLSKQECTEAGWYAYDFHLDEPIQKEFILTLKPLGSFVYLQMLSKPFFKIESEHYLIKGIQGDTFFRMGVHKDYLEELDKVEKLINK